MPHEFFRNLFEGAENTAQAQQQKAQQQKDQDVQMYQQVLMDPNSDPDQRKRAADKITQLRGLDKKESPIGRLADVLNALSQHVKGEKSGQPQPAAHAANQGASPQGAPGATAGGLPPISPLKQGLAQKALHGAERGLGAVLNVADQVLLGSRPESLPPIDASVIPDPSAAARRQTEAAANEIDALMKRGYTREQAMEMEGIKVPASAQGMGTIRLGSPVNGPSLPDDAVDKDGNLIPHTPGSHWITVVSSNRGTFYLPTDPRMNYRVKGNRLEAFDPTDATRPPVDLGVANLGTSSTRETAGVDAEGNPITVPLTSTRTPVTAPPPSGTAHPQPGLKSRSGKSLPKVGEAAAPRGSRQLPGFTPGEFSNFSKGAMGVTEAAASLVGDDPSHPGGLQAQLNVFDDPGKVRKLSEYFAQQDQYLEAAAKGVSGDGTVKYILGLPGYLSDLKSGQLADKYNALDPQSKAFVDAFTRAIGTAPGLRSVSSSSTAMAALRTIEREYPNPVFVKDRRSAQGRLNNLMGEIQQAGSYNPLLRKKLKSLPKMEGGAGKTVKMKAPNGFEKEVPADQVDYYKAHGAVVVQ